MQVPESVVDQKKRTIAVLLCGCGKLFRYDQPFTVDPLKHALDGSLAPFGKDCYAPGAVVIPTRVPKELTFAFETEGLKVYTVIGEIPSALRHEKKP